MTEKPTRPGFAFWATVLLVVVALYMLSSGPMRMVGCQKVVGHSGGPIISTRSAAWYRSFYRPLIWASKKPYGYRLTWYWSLFPIRDA